MNRIQEVRPKEKKMKKQERNKWKTKKKKKERKKKQNSKVSEDVSVNNTQEKPHCLQWVWKSKHYKALPSE
jgi:hypothetical protein